MKVENNYILMFLVVISFFIYSYLSLTSPAYFVSPDENINYFFSKMYAENGTLSYKEDLNKHTFGIIHPRHTAYFNDKVVPVGFLGMYVIFGGIGSFQKELLLYITPLLGALGILFFYILIKESFNEIIAILSSIFLLVLPPYWYWSSMSMINNISAFTFLLIGVLYFFRLLKNMKLSYYILFALFIAASLVIRIDYILLLIPLFIIFLTYYKRFKVTYLFIAMIIFMIVISPVPFLNKQLYGGYLTTGYQLALNEFKHDESDLIPLAVPTFKLEIILQTLTKYYIAFLPIFFLGTILGMIKLTKSKMHITYVFYVILLSITTIIYWGSGIFYGLDGYAVMFSSYTRYFLPLYVFSLPFLVSFVFSVSRKTRLISILLCTVLIIHSVNLVLFSPQGFLETKQQKEKYQQLNKDIVDHTEQNSLIITNYWDKVIFPDRRVAVPLFLDNDTKLSDNINELIEMNFSIYIMEDPKNLPYDEYDQLTKKEYELIRVGKLFMYEVKRKRVI